LCGRRGACTLSRWGFPHLSSPSPWALPLGGWECSWSS
jgi:hypothetical protein